MQLLRVSIMIFCAVIAAQCAHAQKTKEPGTKGGGYYHDIVCRTSGMSMWPFGQDIHPHSLIMLQGIGLEGIIVKYLNTRFPVYLQSSNQKINLEVVSVNDSRSNVVQALLKPMQPLQVGMRYTLHIDNLDQLTYDARGFTQEYTFNENNNGRYHYDKNNMRIYDHDFCYDERCGWADLKDLNFVKERSWLVTADQQMPAPKWIQPPAKYTSIVNGIMQATAAMVRFEMNYVWCTYQLSDSSSSYVIRTQMMDSATQQLSDVFFITDKENRINIGRPNLCYGNYFFEKGKHLSATFDLIDVYGREYKWEGDKVRFTFP